MAETTSILKKAQTYAYFCHEVANHLYDGKPYKTHLDLAFKFGFKYRHLLKEERGRIAPIDVLAGIFVHDTIEDTRQTYNDVKKYTNEAVVEIAYALTNEKGRNRKERAGLKYYCGIRETPGAAFVKICDRLANAKYSKDSNSRMLELYRKEYPEFERMLYCWPFIPMFEELKEILKIK